MPCCWQREGWCCCNDSGGGAARRWGLPPLGVGLVAFGATYYTGYTRADYSAITTHIAALERHGDVDVVLLTGPWQAWYYDYYFRGEIFHHVLPTTAPPAVDQETVETVLADLAAPHERIWLVLSGLAQSDPQRLVERWLLTHAWQGTRQAFDTAELSVFKLHPRKLEAPLRPAQFGAAIELTGGLMEVDEIVSGDVAPFILRFRARQELDRDYRASLRLVGWDGQRIAKDFDLRTAPLAGEPTSRWTPNREVEIRQGLWLPIGLAPGTYEVQLIVYDGGQFAATHATLARRSCFGGGWYWAARCHDADAAPPARTGYHVATRTGDHHRRLGPFRAGRDTHTHPGAVCTRRRADAGSRVACRAPLSH